MLRLPPRAKNKSAAIGTKGTFLFVLFVPFCG